MSFEDLKRILRAFADDPSDLELSKGKLLFQIRDELIEAEVFNREGSLIVSESGVEELASRWLVSRIARLPQLAERILSYIPNEVHFVTPAGSLLDELELAPSDEQIQVSNASSTVCEVLGRRPGGATHVLYLTSDAGEGKSTLINHIARTQAEAYKRKKTDWLLVPITLGGRPFLRFDDVVIGALVNRLRFPFFYYEAFLELVKIGVLVPAFDGFEEMFVQSSSGEALSALGNLMSTLDSAGSVLIAARKAYFEYKSFATQAKLFDAIGSDSVAFSRLSLRRWDRDQFLTYASKRGIQEPDRVYEDVAQRLGPSHPLLTRAVLVRRLLDVADEAEGRAELLQAFGSTPYDYFYQFVNTIIEREAYEKWIDTSGDPAQSLLSVDEHHQLLSLLAQEMWITSTDVLKDEMLDIYADLFSESRRKPAAIARQTKERLKQHSLITSANSNRTSFSFDHEEFRNFFLGQAVGRRLAEGADAELRSILRVGPLPPDAFDAAVQFLRRSESDLRSAAERLESISRTEIATSFTRENAGGLISRMLDRGEQILTDCTITYVVFPPDTLRGRSVERIVFKACNFQASSLEESSILSCIFEDCSFENLEFYASSLVQDSNMINCQVFSISPPDRATRIFGPDAISGALRELGFNIQQADDENRLPSEGNGADENVQLIDRALRAFLRNTHVNENVFKQRLGVRSNQFLDQVLPTLLRIGVIEELQYAGGGNQRRFRLGVPMLDIEAAMASSGGNYDELVNHFERRAR